MTVMFRREFALAVGNYRYFPGFEDYDLWMRMIKYGAVCANHPDVLVLARTGGVYARRRGLGYMRSEWRMQRQLRNMGITNRVNFLYNILARIPVRLLPQVILKWIYIRYARKETNDP
jgi:hypothetical protein